MSSKKTTTKARKTTTSKTKTKAAATTSVAEALATATTPAQKAAATRRLTAYVNEQVAAGKDATQVRAGIKAAITRYTNKSGTRAIAG